MNEGERERGREREREMMGRTLIEKKRERKTNITGQTIGQALVFKLL